MDWSQRFKWWVAYPLLAFLAVSIGVASARFWTFDPSVLNEFLRPNLIDHPILFYTHTTLAPVALLLGVWQFMPVTRRGWWHKWSGRAYVLCVALASVSGLVVAFTTEAGPIAAAGFAILAVLWFGATAMAYRLARAKNFVAHRRWMIRSYALTCSAITLRLILPIGIISGMSFVHAYWLAAWGCWIVNLIVAELLIARKAGRGAVSAAA